MRKASRYTHQSISPKKANQMRQAFFKDVGPLMKLMCDMYETIPNIAFTVKNAEGRIMHMNSYNVHVSGWQSLSDVLGYTSWELYPPDLAEVYGGRDRTVFDSGIPIVNRIYGFVADRSNALNCVSIYPLTNPNGQRIGTATVYYRTNGKMQSGNHLDPIHQATNYLNDHYTESVPVSKLANLSHYSQRQFQRLFKKLIHMTPSEYIVRRRILKAKNLLISTDASITDIALATGFYDHSHFIRLFKEITGTTPLRCRHTHSTPRTITARSRQPNPIMRKP